VTLQLSGYQEVAVERLVDRVPTYACFDPPGAGKTAVAINAALQAGTFPMLITLPAHLVLQWHDELIRWGIPPEEISSAPRGCGPAKRLAALEADTSFCLVSYNSWTNWSYLPLLLDPKWAAFTMDESHRLRRGRHTKGGAWRGVHYLRQKSRSTHLKTPIWWLSGTPMVRDGSDLWPLMAMAEPNRYTSRTDFAKQMCHTADGPYGMMVGKIRDAEYFRRVIGRYSIRRSYDEIPELAKLQRRDISLPVELDRAELARHRTIKRDYRDPVTDEPLNSASAMIRALRRIPLPAKLDALTELLTDHPGRFLALCWYRSSAADIQAKVARSGRHVGMHIDGKTSERERQRSFRIYNDYEDGVLVGTIGSLAEGLNLQRGYQVAFLEQHYLSEANEQALKRVLRRGQTQPVLIYWLWAPKTYDVRVRRVAANREKDIYTALDDFLKEEPWRT
jgi:SNF2 family DNA or RNA helicase